ncbi:hypothetical protein OXPF_36030 [Oxobacter pfennigii]|uniref:Transporter n=1 Tax=Oxobacter pfennigii TaxID=36849 RepID=A0A0P9ACL5_9CLOT|nr:hypothetical protein [Oxobacter pfennigii]KPU42839.1 hypothetical protein OXPF_36030 [Oxobacter pfennigii]
MKNIIDSLKIAFVFVGTVVGAGLASGQEIVQFFTKYGAWSIAGILLCGMLYIIIGVMTMEIAYKFNSVTYRDLIYLCCGKTLGSVIDFLTTFFIFGGTCIILAGSGSIFLEHLGLPHIAGVLAMAIFTAVIVFYSTDGLIFINSIIVPCMIVIITVIAVLSIINRSVSYSIVYDVIHAPIMKNNWLVSTILYTSFNLLFATGVLAPITKDIKKSPKVFSGVIMGAFLLMVLTFTINIVLILNIPHIFNFSIPMLYTAKKFGVVVSTALSVVIWFEMFSTEVANVYSIAKKMNYNFNINYKLSVVLILAAAFPFTKLGFENLIKLLYPAFGFVSTFYIICLIRLYFKNFYNKK